MTDRSKQGACQNGQHPELDKDASIAELHELAEALAASMYSLLRLIRPSLMEFGVTWPQSRTLGVLLSNGPLRVTQLAETEQIAQPAMTSLVSRMEKRDLIVRVPDPLDARANRVCLTEKGERIMVQLRAARADKFAGALAALTPGERDHLISCAPVLAQLVAYLESARSEEAARLTPPRVK